MALEQVADVRRALAPVEGQNAPLDLLVRHGQAMVPHNQLPAARPPNVTIW